jgi:hypothetical protein
VPIQDVVRINCGGHQSLAITKGGREEKERWWRMEEGERWREEGGGYPAKIERGRSSCKGGNK